MTKKRIFLVLFIIIALVVNALIVERLICERTAYTDFSRLIRNEDYDNLKLTIYLDCLLAWGGFGDAERLVEQYLHQVHPNVRRIVVDGNTLAEYSDLLHQFSNFNTTPMEGRLWYHQSVRVYYVFENTRTGRKLSVALQRGIGDFVTVNGTYVGWDEIFYDVIIPFLPEDVVETIEILLGRQPIPPVPELSN